MYGNDNAIVMLSSQLISEHAESATDRRLAGNISAITRVGTGPRPRLYVNTKRSSPATDSGWLLMCCPTDSSDSEIAQPAVLNSSI